MLGAIICMCIIYYLIEKHISDKIPKRNERTAEFRKRVLKDYVDSRVIILLNSLIFVIMVSYIVSFVLHKISLTTFIYNLICALGLFGFSYAFLIYTLKERILHEKDISSVTKHNIDQNRRKTAIFIIVFMCIIFSIVFLIELVFQCYGYDLVQSPEKIRLYRLLGQPNESRVLLTMYHWDMIISAISVPLFLFISNSKSNRDILSIKVIKD
jgi:uncharacterized membrane protein